MERFEALKELGCIACRKESTNYLWCGPVEVHHLNFDGKAGQKRRGHDYTIPLGKYHHQGIRLSTHSAQDMQLVFGPSLKLKSKAFRERYGTDDELLAEVNKLIGVAV